MRNSTLIILIVRLVERVTRVFRVTLAKETSERLDGLVKKAVFLSYSEAIRRALELLLEQYHETKP